jgi:hypothetical protein
LKVNDSHLIQSKTDISPFSRSNDTLSLQTRADSLGQLQGITLIVQEEPDGLNGKDLIPLGAPIVIVFIFIIERFLNFRSHRRELKRRWFSELIVNPNLQKVTEFFSELKKHSLKEHKKLKKLKEPDSGFNQHAIRKQQAYANLRIKSRLRNFEFECIQIFESYDHKTHSDLMKVSLDLEDLIIRAFDSDSKLDENYFRNSIQSYKSEFFKIIYNKF